MWYRDIDLTNVNEAAAVSSTVDYFDCSEETARNIVVAAARFNEYGSRGEWPFDPCDQHAAMREAFATYASHERFGGLDKHDVGDLFLDAWEEALHDGIQPEMLANAALFAALADLIGMYGEDAVAKMANGLSRRIQLGEFTLKRTPQ